MDGPVHGTQPSEQIVSTPLELLDAVIARFGPLYCDLAACEENSVCDMFIDEEEDSLARGTIWPGVTSRAPNNWLNPPFKNIYPWAEKCLHNAEKAPALFLVLASVSSEWWRKFVWHKADVAFLTPRVKFVGYKAGSARDLALCHFHPAMTGQVQIWDWKKGILF